jgi:predicted phosphoadenosine phosphosulfate sulfurtransferase
VSELKRPLGKDVLTAARERIALVFDRFPRIYVSFSGGKDSTVMLHLVMDEAIRRGRKIGVLFIDLEAQYQSTIEHVANCFELYRDHIEPYWVCLPLSLRNAVSMFEPRWECWDPSERERWVRPLPAECISDVNHFPFFERGMEFEQFVLEFGNWYSGGVHGTCCLVGIRADESLNRFRTLIMKKTRLEGRSWTTWISGAVFNAYPIYDWRTADLWVYTARTKKPHNRLYDLMHQAGLSIHQMRICQPYGDDQRKGLWLYHALEPATWPKVVARVGGANAGALYCGERGNVLGNHKIDKPAGHTWQSYARLLLESLPPVSRQQFEEKIGVFLRWYADKGYIEGIPDEEDPKLEASRKVPSWRRVCKAILKNDFWCKSLSFGPPASNYYERYCKLLKTKKATWEKQKKQSTRSRMMHGDCSPQSVASIPRDRSRR